MEKNERTITETTVTLTKDELICVGAEACAKMTVKKPTLFLIRDELSTVIALMAAILFDKEEEEK